MRVILADDSVLFREGLARVLTERGIEVIGQVADGTALIDHVREHLPDLVIVDIRFGPSQNRVGSGPA